MRLNYFKNRFIFRAEPPEILNQLRDNINERNILIAVQNKLDFC